MVTARVDNTNDPRESYRRAFERDLRYCYASFKEEMAARFTDFEQEPMGKWLSEEVALTAFVTDLETKPEEHVLTSLTDSNCDKISREAIDHFKITFPELKPVLEKRNQVALWRYFARYGVFSNMDDVARLVYVGSHRWFKCSATHSYQPLSTVEAQCQAAGPLLLHAAGRLAQPTFHAFLEKCFPARKSKTDRDVVYGYQEVEVKSYGSIMRKIREYNVVHDEETGDHYQRHAVNKLDFWLQCGKITDVCRSTISVGNAQELQQAMDKIKKKTP